MFITAYYFHWDVWNLNHKLVFDGENKLIIIPNGITEIDVKVDIYSDWKEWSQLRDNTKYEAAIRAVGGNEIAIQRALGGTFFLINGWRIKGPDTNAVITLNGNIFTDNLDGILFEPIDGNYSVQFELTTSNINDDIGDSTITTETLAASVWDEPVENSTTADSMGEKVRKNLTK